MSKGQKFGLMMPGNPKLGQRFFQERAPGVGMDRAEILSDTDKITSVADHKWYAAGVGQVKEAEMVLVTYGGK